MAPNQSDTDDWTLVSPPHSADGSPTRKSETLSTLEQTQEVVECIETFPEQSEESNNSEENYSADNDDGLTEIDLNDENDQNVPNKRVRFRLRVSKKDDNRKRKTNCCQTKCRAKFSSKTSATQRQQASQLSLVDVTETSLRMQSNKSGFEIQKQQHEHVSKRGQFPIGCPVQLRDSSNSLCAKLRNRFIDCSSVEEKILYYKLYILPLVVLIAAILLGALSRSGQHANQSMYFWRFANLFDGRNGTFNLVDVDPASHTYLQLKSLDEDIAECIMNESPELGKAKGGGEFQSRFYGKNPSKSANAFVHYKPYKGLVCYEREMDWRKRFNKLKNEHDLDLRKVLKQARKRFTSEMLETYHPSLRFKLIINQLEYLDYIEEKRKDKALERLKVENLELMRKLHKLKQETGGGPTRSMSKSEVENAKLKQENDALKANLAEKAGTVYIKQSLELERCGRENNALKQFHYQVAKEVSRNLKQLNLHSIEATAILDDQKSLESQLSLTRGYLLRLGEEINNLVSRNKGLAQKLTDLQLLNNQTIKPTTQQDAAEASTVFGYYGVKEGTGKPYTAPETGSKRLLDSSSIGARSSTGLSEREANTCVESYRGGSPLSVSRERANWLMQRAKLRERLREGAGIDAIERQIDNLLQSNANKHISSHSSNHFKKNKKHHQTSDESRGRAYQAHTKRRKQKHNSYQYHQKAANKAGSYGNQEYDEGHVACCGS